jgi:phage shock protein PspC (stress-responsive transcriptional regulator)
MSDTITDTPTLDEAPPRRLVRSDEGRWLGGVCAGLGRYFDINPLVYRIAFAALALAGGTGLLLYLAAYLVIPAEHSEESIAVEALQGHREHPWLLVGVGLLSFGALFLLSEARFWPGTGNLWLAATLGGGAIVWWHVSNRDRAPRQAESTVEAAPTVEASTTETVPGAPPVQVPAPAPSVPRTPKRPRKPSLFAPVLGALLAAAGLFGLLAVLDIYDIDVAVGLAAGVLIVGAAIAVGAMTQRRVGGLVFLGLTCWVRSASPPRLRCPCPQASAEDRAPRERVGARPELRARHRRAQPDLSAVSLSPGTTSVDANVGIGNLVITVPRGIALEVDAHAGVGEVDVLGRRDDGVDAQKTVSVDGSSPNGALLNVEADIGMGNIEVRRG